MSRWSFFRPDPNLSAAFFKFAVDAFLPLFAAAAAAAAVIASSASPSSSEFLASSLTSWCDSPCMKGPVFGFSRSCRPGALSSPRPLDADALDQTGPGGGGRAVPSAAEEEQGAGSGMKPPHSSSKSKIRSLYIS